jgi:hypothetical protein
MKNLISRNKLKLKMSQRKQLQLMMINPTMKKKMNLGNQEYTVGSFFRKEVEMLIELFSLSLLLVDNILFKMLHITQLKLYLIIKTFGLI